MVLRLFRLEVRKSLRRRELYVSIALLAILISAMFLGFATFHWERWFVNSRRPVYLFLRMYVERQEHRTFSLSEFINGLFFTGMVVGVSFHVLIPILASLIGGILVAGEAKDGTLRAVLVRPVSRSQLLLAKFGAAVVSTFALMLFYFGFALLLGVPTFGWNRIPAYNNVFMHVGEGRGAFFLMEAGVAFRRLALAGLLGGYAMLVVTTLSLFLSTVFDSPIVPVVGGMGLYLISGILEAEPYFESVKKYLITSHMFFWRDLFSQRIPWEDIRPELLWCTGYIVFFLLAALAVFRFRDVRT